MKKTKYSLYLMLMLFFVACGPKKNKVDTPNGEKEFELPCSNFTSSKDVFRVSSVGESKDLNIAKRKALSNARTQLAGEISTTMKVVGDNYVKSSEFNNVEEVLERFEENSRTVITEQLNGAKSVCERTTRSKESGNYMVYLALELSAQDVVSKYHETLSKDQKLQVDYNYEKFKETFDKEMENRK